MSDSAPNFRLHVKHDEDTEPVRTTLREVLADNEGVPSICDAITKLQPGGELRVDGGWVYTRPIVSPSRYTRLRVPIDLKEFRGSDTATVTLDRKRLTISFRPRRKRTLVTIPLSELAELYLAKQVKLDAIARKKARRARR